MKKLLYPALGLLLVAALFYSCKKYETKNLEISGYDAEYAIPLVNTSTTLTDILENFDSTTFLLIGDDGLLTLNYKGNVTGQTSDDLFDVLNQFQLIPIGLDSPMTVIELPPVEGLEIDFAILKTGSIKFGFLNDHDEEVEVSIHMPTFTLNGVPFTSTITTSQAGPGAIGISPTESLVGYRLETVGNTLPISYTATRMPSGIVDTLADIYIIFEEFKASYLEGYMGNALYELDRDTIEIDFFEDWTRGDVYFEDPKLTLTVENSFGIPVRSKANIVDVHTATGEILPLESIFFDSIDISYPSLNEVGQIKYTNFDFNTSNSNIDDILGATPVLVDYDMDALPNPDSITSIRGFVTDSSYIKVQVEVELPVWGAADGFVARDTFGINLSTYDNVENAEFKIVTENEIGLDVGVQIYFADDNGAVIDSLLPSVETVLTAAPVDSEGNATGFAEKTTFINFDALRFDNVRNAKKLYVAISFSTVNNGTQSIKVYNEDEMRIRVGMKLGLMRE